MNRVVDFKMLELPLLTLYIVPVVLYSSSDQGKSNTDTDLKKRKYLSTYYIKYFTGTLLQNPNLKLYNTSIVQLLILRST
jgi:hypothetical protein